MDSIIPLGQKNTLAEYMILSGADNRPPMLDKDLYDSWKSIMELYMQNSEHRRMILESIENGPLILPIGEENGVTRTKEYAELSAAKKIQIDYDMKATNIILQGINKNKPPGFKQDVQEKPHDDGVENKSLSIPERVTHPLSLEKDQYAISGVRIQSLLDAVGITAALVCVNATQLELVLLENFN
nr:hypothetical protein [Tanacetum cinerariifolium]